MKTLLTAINSLTDLIKMVRKAILEFRVQKKVGEDEKKIDEAFNESDAQKLRDTFND